MSHFIVWVFCTWAGILLAALIALYLPVKPGPAFQPKPAAPPADPAPKMPALWTIPPHVVDWRQPLEGEANRVVRPYTPDVVEAPRPPVVPAEPVKAPVEAPRPIRPTCVTPVVPLWTAREEDRQQAARRHALEAASAGLTDPGYTYRGAQVLTGAGA
ncbi:hypothetical protein ACFZDG_10995 [Kitasatospora xanthocidica]|uniref:hypothetical protein n=1 Tax=Kitasatospora xanthocidica TaxID=83382 RepID=UPI0036E32D40